jgi:protein-tyrosine phosphatase
MFKLFSKSKHGVSGEKPDYSLLKTDMHSHLLPGIDDGSPDLKTSVELIKGMISAGFTKFITTPHIMWEMYKNTPGIIEEKLELVRNALEEENIEVEINAAAEYFLDDHVESLLKRGEKLLTISGNLVLCEFSLAYKPHSLQDILFEMQMQGYQPVIAHPERYTYLEGNKDFYEDLKATGCWFQLNILSLAGYYGRTAQELAQHLIKKGYYDLIGTDLHGFRHLDKLSSLEITQTLKKLVESGKIKNHTL